MPLGEEAELADAHQAGGEHVEQEAAQELDGVKRHEFGAGAVRVIFPFETRTLGRFRMGHDQWEALRASVGLGRRVG